MIDRKTNSQRVPPCSARTSRSDSVHHWSDRDNTFANPRFVVAEAGNPVCDDRPNKPSARILVETEINGRVDLYEFISFRHAQPSSQKERGNNGR